MRKIDKEKSSAFGKAAKTINFDKIVLKKLEERAKAHNTNASNIVNAIVKRVVMTDIGFYKHVAKEHYMQFQRYKYMAEELAIQVEIK